MKRAYGIVAVLIFVFAVVFTLGNSVAQAQRGGRAARPATTMDSTPQTFDTREYAIRVVPVAAITSSPVDQTTTDSASVNNSPRTP